MSFTSNDIAQICGVSRTTVYRALTGTGRINQETKERILQVAKENNYTPDLLARSLAKGTTRTISVIVMNVTNQHFSQMLNCVEQEARKKDFRVNITLHNHDAVLEREQIQQMMNYHVDGIILSSVINSHEYSEFIRRSSIPIVTIDNKIAEDIPFVGVDDRAAIYKVTRMAVQKEYEKIVFVSPKLPKKGLNYVHEERIAGFLEAVQQASREGKKIVSQLIYTDIPISNRSGLELTEGKTVFICSGDIFALELMEYFRKQGKEAGKDYGLVGFDHIDMLHYISPKLTTIDNATSQVATEAVKMLMALIEHQEVNTERILKTRFIPGDTF